MLKTLVNAFKIKEIRKKLLFDLLMLVIIRIGSVIPTPGINREYFTTWFEQSTGGSFSFIDAFTGGSFQQMSILALSITPYITSSIIMQLLTIAIPKLEEMQNEGEDGRKKIVSITRYVTIILALIESTAMAISFGQSNILTGGSKVLDYISIVAILTAGSAFLMWAGEQITEKGVGNGISIVLLINILSRVPYDLSGLYDKFMHGKTVPKAVLAGVIIFAIIVLMIVLVVLLNDGIRKVPVQYARRTQGSQIAGASNSYIPVKVNTAGVIPVIFASSFLQLPLAIFNMTGVTAKATGFWKGILDGMNSNNWCKPGEWILTIGMLVYIGLVIFFAYFYTNITFNPIEIANNLKKNSGFIPGIRPGKPTSDYLNMVVNRIIFIGAVGLTIVCIIPYFFNGIFGANVSFGGTSLIIIVSVIIETINQVESQMLVRNYKGFLKD